MKIKKRKRLEKKIDFMELPHFCGKADSLFNSHMRGDAVQYEKAEQDMAVLCRIANNLPLDAPYKPAHSPMSQFDESHARWLMHRDC